MVENNVSVFVYSVVSHIQCHWFRKNEDQLAYTLGHEIAHAILGHAVC